MFMLPHPPLLWLAKNATLSSGHNPFAMAERALGDQAAGMLHANACANAVRPHPREERITVPTNPWTQDAFVSLILAAWQYHSGL